MATQVTSLSDLEREKRIDSSWLNPIRAHQIGDTSSYHAITTVLYSAHVAFLSRCDANLPFSPLSVQYLYDSQPIIKKFMTLSFAKKVGILETSQYAVNGQRGVVPWVPDAITGRSHFRVDGWFRIDPKNVHEVAKALKFSAVYADFCAPSSIMELSTVLPITGTIVFSEEERIERKLEAHSIAIIGMGNVRNTNRHYYVFENTNGPLFGDGGFGRIYADTVASIFAPMIAQCRPIVYEQDPRSGLMFAEDGSDLLPPGY